MRAEARLGDADRFLERHAAIGVLAVEDAPVGEHQSIRRHARAARRPPSASIVARALGRLNRRVAHHQRDAARVRAEIDRREIGVAGDRAHVERIDAEHLRHHRHQHVVRSLADLGGAAEHGDAAAAIQLQLHAGVRQVVPVDRQAGAGEIRRAREADAAAERQLAELLAASSIARRPAGCTRRGRWCRRAGSSRSASRAARRCRAAARRDRSSRRSAILSSCTSWPKRDCGVPWPRFGPHGGLLVKTRQPRKR